ncbi:MAG: TetR family transcriptional regulator [Nonomuraea sp.]|nr:TetR family transcriptional regulator [Nonomuraea sp.]
MPTGVAMRDPRDQLFDAAERILLRDGANALTSRAVTAEAGCAKGVLHRHFADFDAFLAELILDRAGVIEFRGHELRSAAGTGTVDGNLTRALTDLFGSVALAVVGLITFRDEVRLRLRQAGLSGVPILTQAVGTIAGYLSLEREFGRIAADADVDSLALALIGAGHLLFADREAGPPAQEAVESMVNAVIADVVQRRLL